MRSGVRGARAALAMLASAVLVVGPLTLAGAAPLTSLTYTDGAYSSFFVNPPTQKENQSKLWFHADAWWAMLVEPTGSTVRVFELMRDHTWRPTSAVIDARAAEVGDALRDGDTVHVINRSADGGLYYVRLTFDPATRDYVAAAPVLVTNRGVGSPATIAKDTGGRLWVGYANALNVVITYSDDGRTWAEPEVIALTGNGTTPETAAMVAYDDQVGILWSDQASAAFKFASHRVGDDPLTWTFETARAGPALADNHISLLRVPGQTGDTLVAAVKTSKGDAGEAPDEPLIEVLSRAADGQWSNAEVATVADGLNDPIIQVDATTRTLYLFASAAGSIVEKRTSLDDIRFAPGLGNLYAVGDGGGLVDPTGTKDPVDSRSGLVLLTSDAENLVYRHAEMPILGTETGPETDDAIPPDAPARLQGRALSPGSVVLSWPPATDGDRWAPAARGVPVAGYVVSRNGVEIDTVTTTSFPDQPRQDSATTTATVQYEVQAVDEAGNRSAPVRVVVELPAASSPLPMFIGVGLLALAALVAGYGILRRRRLRRGMASADVPAPRASEPVEPARRSTPNVR